MSLELPKPTDAELAILRVLWDRGPSTVREVHEALHDTRAAGYTTILKLLQIMTEKKLVTRDETARSHVYMPAGTEASTQQQLVTDLMQRAFGGSAARLVMQALAAAPATADEMQAIRRLLDERRGVRK
jgi:BlaI family transcriptional regulator, penicillinase repressor